MDPTAADERKEEVSNSSDDDVFNDAAADTIPQEYRGTKADKRDMHALGKKQVLRRNFKFATLVGFASTAIISWESLLPTFTFILTDGGTGILFWGFIGVSFAFALAYASLAEMASMSPTAGGQYHWVSEFAPPRYQRVLSYLVGWLTATGWQVYLAAISFMQGTLIQGLIALNNDDYTFLQWHGTLLAIASVMFAIIFNTVLAVKLPLVEGIVLILHVAGFFAIIIPLWVMAPRAPARVLVEFSNDGGWPSTGIAAMIGLQTPVSALVGYDCSVHMSEEIRDASITLPRALMWAFGGNAILAFLMAVTLAITMGDKTGLADTSTRQPFIHLFYNATRSKGATSIMTAIVIVMLSSCCISEVATASRQLWSFSRDGGFPCSKWLSVVPPGWNLPIRSVLISFFVVSLLSCINLGSKTALNAINSLGGLSILTSYMITISCLIWRRLKGAPLPPRRWSLGRFGLAINIAAVCTLMPPWFFALWPLATPVTAATMNWSQTMFGSVIIFAGLWWLFKARHIYTGPVMQMKRKV